ncbi:MAG: aldo/keto reductase [Alphaproteobacteria bacterium]
MKTRKFGSTGIEIPEIIFGGGRVGGILIFADDDIRRAAVRRALDSGIDWFDTAMSYGNGKSEEALGWLLEEVPETPRVSTKVTIDLDRLDDIPGQIEHSVHQSLARLRMDSVELLQLHGQIEAAPGGRAIASDDILKPGGVLDGMERLRDQGLTRFLGLTALGDAAEICKIIDSGRVDSAQVYYNMINPSAGQAMPPGWTGHDFGGVMAACRAHGMAIMAIRIFAAGYLATAERQGRESILTKNTIAAEEERKAQAVFDILGDQYGSRAQTATRFVLGNPDVSCAIVGLAETAHLDEAVAAMEMGPLPEAAMARLEGLYATDFADESIT